MISKDDLDVSTLRVIDKLNRMEAKIDKLIKLDCVSDDAIFDATEVRSMFGISDATLWRYRKKGLKSHKSKRGRRLFYYKDLMEFIRGEM